jgi:hypothetical protein
VVKAAVGERLGDRLVGIGQLDVLADEGDPHRPAGRVGSPDELLPVGEVG